MRIIRSAAALALLSPALAAAQVTGTNQPVAVEIVASGDLEVPATKLTMTISFTETGPSQTAADKARDAKIARIEQALQEQGLAPSALSPLSGGEPPLSITTVEVGPVPAAGKRRIQLQSVRPFRHYGPRR